MFGTVSYCIYAGYCTVKTVVFSVILCGVNAFWTSSIHHKSFNYENNFLILTVNKKKKELQYKSNRIESNKPNWATVTNIWSINSIYHLPLFMLVIKFVQYEHSEKYIILTEIYHAKSIFSKKERNKRKMLAKP